MSSWMSGEFSCNFERLGSISLVNVLSSTSLSGAFTIQGGYQLLRKKLQKIILSYQGVIVTHVPIQQLLFNDKNEVIGVMIKSDTKEIIIKSLKGVISGIGMIPTFIQLIPSTVSFPSVEKTRQKLKKLEVKRPKMYLVYYLKGTRESLGLSAYEYVELHNNENSLETQNISDNDNNYNNQSFKVWSPSIRDETWSTQLVIFYLLYISHSHLLINPFIFFLYYYSYYF